jgi:hypothetical protein
LRVLPGDGADWLLAMLPGACAQAGRDQPAALIAESDELRVRKSSAHASRLGFERMDCCLGVYRKV